MTVCSGFGVVSSSIDCAFLCRICYMSFIKLCTVEHGFTGFENVLFECFTGFVAGFEHCGV